MACNPVRATCSSAALALTINVLAPSHSGAQQALPTIEIGGQRAKSTGRTASRSSGGTARPAQPQTAGGLATADAGPGNWNNLLKPNHSFTETRSSVGAKTNTPLIEVPQSISVVTRGQLDARNVETDSEALLYTPSVLAQPFGASVDQFNPYYIIRGFQTAFGGSYVDSLVSPVNYRHEPYAFDRYDILRGPTSVLYGQADPGGLINRTTKRPQAERASEMRLQFGNYDWQTIAGDSTGPLDPDGNLLYRFTFLYRNANNAVNFDRGPTLPDNRLYIAPAITWKVTPDTSLTVLGSVLADDASAPAYFVTSDYVATRTSINRPGMDDSTYKQHYIGYMLEHRFDDTLSFRQRFRYSNMDFDIRSLGQSNVGSSDLTAFGFVEDRNDTVLDNNLEKRLTTGPVQHTILLGFDYQHLRDRVNFLYNFNEIVPFNFAFPNYSNIYVPFSDTQRQNAITNNYGIYIQDQMKIYDRWVLTLGGRYDWNRGKFFGYDSFGYGLDYFSPYNETSRNQAFSWRAGLNYLFDNGLAPYFSYATSFLPTGGVNTLTNVPFKPTTAEQYEAGVKFQPPGTRSLFTFAAYDLTKQNVVTSTQLPGLVLFQNQTGEIKSRGIELEATSDVTDNLRIQGAYAYTVAKTTKASDGSENQTPSQIPRNMASFWMDYKILGDTVLGGLSFGGGVRYIGSTYAWNTDIINFPDEGPRLRNRAYTLFDAAIRYDLGYALPQLKGAQLAVNANNVFNAGYQICYTRFDCRLGAPMTVLGTLRYRF